ncbi:MAG: hypothetical protein MJ106_00425 [Lentisphaeria bacterium]|nr:hypothetical protein [Lentisphaeria bacterium]
MKRSIILIAGLCMVLSSACLQAQFLKKLGNNLKKSINDTAEKLAPAENNEETKSEEAAPAVAKSEEAAPAAVEEAKEEPAPAKKADDVKKENASKGKFQPSVTQVLEFEGVAIDDDPMKMILPLEKKFSLEYGVNKNFGITRLHGQGEDMVMVGTYRGRDVDNVQVDKRGIHVPFVKGYLKSETVNEAILEANNGFVGYIKLVKEFTAEYGTPHQIIKDKKRDLCKIVYTFWQFKNCTLVLLTRISEPTPLVKEMAKANPEDPRLYYDDLDEVYHLKDSALFEQDIALAMHCRCDVWYLTKEGLKYIADLPCEPLELGKAEEFAHKDDPKAPEGLDPNRKPVGEIPASIPKNAIFDVKTQSVVCYYKGQKFFADEACTEMLYSHPGNTVGTEHPVPYGKGLFRFASGRMYKENSYNNADVVGSIIEVRTKKGDVLEAKIFDKCVFARDVEKVDNDKGEDIYKFKLSFDNVERAEIPATYTYKEGRLYRGDSTEDRDCVMVIDPTLNSARLLFVALTFVK